MRPPGPPPAPLRCSCPGMQDDCVLHGRPIPDFDHNRVTLRASYASLVLWTVGTVLLIAGYESSVAGVVLRVLGWSALGVALLVHAYGWALLTRSLR